MAKNIMYFIHIPSGLRVYIGKRMGVGWYNVPDNLGERIKALFDRLDGEYYSQDDFAIALENADDTSMALELKDIYLGDIVV